MRTTFIAVAALLMLGGCLTLGGVQQISSAPPRIESARTAAVAVTGGPGKLAESLRSAIVAELKRRKVFNTVVAEDLSGAIAINAAIREAGTEGAQGVNRVLATLTGPGTLKVDVTVVDGSTDQELARLSVSGGLLTFGRDAAVQDVAVQVADYLLANRRM